MTSPAQLVVRSSEFRSQLFSWKPQILQLKVSFTIPTMMEPKMLPLKLSCMDFPQIRVHLLLFTEYAIVKSLFLSNEQSHMTKIVDVCRRSQPPRLPLNSRSTCFGSIGNREVGNACLVLKAWQKIGVTFDSHQVKYMYSIRLQKNVYLLKIEAKSFRDKDIVRIQRVIWDHLLAFKGEIIQKQALSSLPCRTLNINSRVVLIYAYMLSVLFFLSFSFLPRRSHFFF